ACPWDRDLGLVGREEAHRRRAFRRRQPGARGEEAGGEGGEVVRASDLVGWGASFECQTREPAGDVERRVAERGVVPVEQDGAAVADAEVVAAHIAVEDRIPGERRPLRRRDQRGQDALEPLLAGEPGREERLRVIGDRLPARYAVVLEA